MFKPERASAFLCTTHGLADCDSNYSIPRFNKLKRLGEGILQGRVGLMPIFALCKASSLRNERGIAEIRQNTCDELVALIGWVCVITGE